MEEARMATETKKAAKAAPKKAKKVAQGQISLLSYFK